MAVAILCNGMTLLEHDLSKIDCRTIGVNRSWEAFRSDYHVMVDPAQWSMYRRITGQEIEGWSHGTLFTGTNGPEGPNIRHIQILESEEPRFSFKTGKAYLCGSVAWAALQIAVHSQMGWGETVYFIGLDLMPRGSKGKFWGGEWFSFMEARQRELFGYARGLFECRGSEMELINVNEPDKTKLRALPIVPFGEVFG